MLVSRVLSRVSGGAARYSSLLATPIKQQSSVFSNQLRSLVHQSPIKAPMFHSSTINNSAFERFWSSSSSTSSSEPSDKEQGNNTQTDEPAKAKEAVETSKDTKVTEQKKESESESDSDSGSDDELSKSDLVKLVTEKEQLLKIKQEEIEQMKDKVLRTYAEMENVMDRTRREAENSKKFAIQNFAKSLLDVADNLGRASSVVKESFSKIDTSQDTAGAVPLLKTLLEGVEMTEKQLGEVFRKFGVEKYDPINEPFDPNRHAAVYQVPDASKPPGTVANVLKAGYTLFDRVIRPAEVGVTQAVEEEEKEA